MVGKKDLDATKKLNPDEPTQVTPKGLKIGLPTKQDVDREEWYIRRLWC